MPAKRAGLVSAKVAFRNLNYWNVALIGASCCRRLPVAARPDSLSYATGVYRAASDVQAYRPMNDKISKSEILMLAAAIVLPTIALIGAVVYGAMLLFGGI